MKKVAFKHFVILAVLLSSPIAKAKIIEIKADKFEKNLNEAVEFADPGTEIIMPEGRFEMQGEVAITKAGIILRGQGMSKTVLSFRNQKVGSQGILGSSNGLVFSDFAVEDSWGNGIKVVQAKGVTFKRVRVTWTKGADENNGAYGLYPVMSRNVLIEDCEVSGASDAGVYVGQSENIIVKGTKAFGNVAGIEIENSRYADVFNNHAFNNTAGILIFNLPQLPVKGGRQTRVFSNKIENNNLRNFATQGSIIKLVPDGLGVFIMANSEVEVFNNEIIENDLTGVGIVNYAVAERKFDDAGYDPMPRHIYIYNNTFTKKKFKFPSFDKMNIIIKILLGFSTPEILYDGISDGTFSGSKINENDRLCIQNNKTTNGEAVTFGNLHLDNQRKWFPFPGGPATNDLAVHDCAYKPFPEIKLESALPLAPEPARPSEKEVLAFCNLNSDGINWSATEYDCPKLSDYHLFKNSEDSTQAPLETGFEYKLNNELFTDYAEKHRFIFLPKGQKMGYKDAGVFDFPKGTIIAKTFSFYIPNEKKGSILNPIETRLLIKRKNGWQALEYIWDSEKKNAFLMLGGEVRSMKILAHNKTSMDIDYGIPNRRQCASCHMTDENLKGQLFPIGPKAKFLNWVTQSDSGTEKKNQLLALSEKSLLKDFPNDGSRVPKIASWNSPETGSFDQRAKAYLEINCAHCHSAIGPAASTGLYLQTDIPSGSISYGRCKHPVAAGMGSGGRFYDVNPGLAEKSILPYRMKHIHLAVRMPQLGRSVVHSEAVDLINSWINAMDGRCE